MYDALKNKSWLTAKYCDEGKTIYEIADIIGCFPSSVARALHRHGAQVRFGRGELNSSNICRNPKCGKVFDVGGRDKPPRDQKYCSRSCHMYCQDERPHNHNLGMPSMSRSVDYHEDRDESQRRLQRYHRTGINSIQFEEMSKAQNGVCAICQKEESDLRADGSERYLSVDHDHKTGKTRQLLCRKCNLIIGLAKDDCTVLKSAIEYLEKHNACLPLS